jgi:alkanesulfonate monooxygenase SsuD/methylene tetrahydromethanopterin reductase-like flavin-dependent oxidoreductase (luciferase family)
VDRRVVDPSRREATVQPTLDAVAAAGRDRNEFTIATLSPVCVADSVEEAIAGVKPWVTFYLGAMGAKEKSFYVELADRYGYGEAAREVQERYLAGDQTGAADALPDQLVQSVTVATDADGLRARLAEFGAAGVDLLIALPGGDELRTVRALAGAVG